MRRSTRVRRPSRDRSLARGTAYVFTSASDSPYLGRMGVAPSRRDSRPVAEAVEGCRLADAPAIYVGFGCLPPEAGGWS
jgi:hypothetical protein